MTLRRWLVLPGSIVLQVVGLAFAAPPILLGLIARTLAPAQRWCWACYYKLRVADRRLRGEPTWKPIDYQLLGIEAPRHMHAAECRVQATMDPAYGAIFRYGCSCGLTSPPPCPNLAGGEPR